MLHKPCQRRLIVIVSADVAGYARLTELNEVDTHTTLQARLNIIRELTKEFNGHVLRIHGDGCLCGFDSVTSALKACLEIQQTSNLLNVNLSDHSQIWFRIGIHLSEVIIDESEPYGNGVNIATRLQQYANPGEILVSERTIQSLDHSLGFVFSKSKKIKFKNISTAVAASKLLGHQIENVCVKNANKHSYFSYLTLAAISFIICASIFSQDVKVFYNEIIPKANITHSETVHAVSDLITVRNDFHKINSAQDIAKAELISKTSQPTGLNTQLGDLTFKLDQLNIKIAALQNKISHREDYMGNKLNAVASILAQHEKQLDDIITAQYDTKYIQTNLVEDTKDYLYEDEFLSNDYVVKSIDSIHQGEVSIAPSTSFAKKENTFGCLSCSNHAYMRAATARDEKLDKNNIRNSVVFFGGLKGEGVTHFSYKSNVIESYVFAKVQDSIKQSVLGEKIAKYTHLTDSKYDNFDNELGAEICEDENILLVVNYELMVNQWQSTGTHLHFYNCTNGQSTSHLEKNLAPTIKNVKQPYLTDDALLKVHQSVDYMVDKLNRPEYL